MSSRLGTIVALVLVGGCAPRAASTSPPPTAPPPAHDTNATTPGDDAAVVATATPDPLAAVTIAARPDWMDRFAAENQGDMRFFDISALMKAHGIDRDRAVELQNHFRDRSREQPAEGPAAWYEHARTRVANGEFEDRRDVAKLRDAPFVIVFDLDETLYDQSYDATVAERCHDLAVVQGDKTKRVKLAPGANAALDRVAALGGAVAIFSAAPDASTMANLRAWSFGGKPLPEHPAIAGVLTNSHLVLQTKHEGPGATQPRKGRPVVEPSKDLRIFDETLRKVVLVDDNPVRTFQPANVRLVPKFDADAYCTTTDAKLRRAIERILPTVVEEIEESVRYMRSAKVDFAIAYLPYSQIGRLAVEQLRTAGMSQRAAIAHLRAHPEITEREF